MPQPLVDAQGLTKRFRVGGEIVHAVSKICFSIEPGEFVAIIGRSGSGKSTLLSLLGLLDRPDTGRYLFDGREVADLNEEARAEVRSREIGFVFQFPTLLPRSNALDNVELPLIYARVGGRERRFRAMAALDRVGLGHRHDHWPSQLSGGEQQRVAIARALACEPSLILADEPTGALDSKTGEAILSLFQDLNRDGRTVVLVTHAPDIARRADRCITLHDGAIVADEHRQSGAAPAVVLAAGIGVP